MSRLLRTPLGWRCRGGGGGSREGGEKTIERELQRKE